MSASRLALLSILACSMVAFHVGTSRAASFTVNTTRDDQDASPGDGTCATAHGDCSLRAAIQETNALAGPDSIQVPAGHYPVKATRGEPVDEDAAASGDLDITDDLTITGAGVDVTFVQGKNARDSFNEPIDRVFHVLAGATATLSDLTIRGGAHAFGAGIENLGILTLIDVRVTHNHACAPTEAGPEGFGGGIESSGTLTLTSVRIDHNVACGQSGRGGGIANNGTATLTNVTIDHNKAASGGGIENGQSVGTVDATNTTIAFNKAVSSERKVFGFGGAIANGNVVHLTNCTVANNIANGKFGGYVGSAIDNQRCSCSITVLRNTIVAHNKKLNCIGNTITVPPATDQPGFIISRGGNLEDGHSANYSTCGFYGPTDQLATDPVLGGLSESQFPPTMALLPGSPAIDAANDAVCPATDERGAPRPIDGDGNGKATCDVGAYEVQS